MQLGAWLKVNGEAIYKTSPWTFRQDPVNADVWYTCTDKNKLDRRHKVLGPPPNEVIFTIFLKWPDNNKLKLRGLAFLVINGKYRMQLLERDGRIPIKVSVFHGWSTSRRVTMLHIDLYRYTKIYF